MKTQITPLVLVSLSACTFAASTPDEGYVAHEWGTFTSVQGMDGNPLEWHPLVTTELTSFVHDRGRSEPGIGTTRVASFPPKSAFVALQRMETPVLYFYSPTERTVGVDVSFPLGLIPEWYPEAGSASGTISGDATLSGQNGRLRWPKVQVFPRQAYLELATALPEDKSGSHYFAAPGADADFLGDDRAAAIASNPVP